MEYTRYRMSDGRIKGVGRSPNPPKPTSKVGVLEGVMGEERSERVDLTLMELVTMDPVPLTISSPAVWVYPQDLTLDLSVADCRIRISNDGADVFNDILSSGSHTIRVPMAGRWNVNASHPMYRTIDVTLEAP